MKIINLSNERIFRECSEDKKEMKARAEEMINNLSSLNLCKVDAKRRRKAYENFVFAKRTLLLLSDEHQTALLAFLKEHPELQWDPSTDLSPACVREFVDQWVGERLRVSFR